MYAYAGHEGGDENSEGDRQ